MEVIEYQKKYKQDFIRLNTAWVEKYFIMEETDPVKFYRILMISYKKVA